MCHRLCIEHPLCEVQTNSESSDSIIQYSLRGASCFTTPFYYFNHIQGDIPMITRSPIYNVARSLTSSQYEFIERGTRTWTRIPKSILPMQLLAFWSKKRTLRAFNLRVSVEKMVPLTGLEPVLSNLRQILSLLCLPFHHSGICIPQKTRDGKLEGCFGGMLQISQISNSKSSHFSKVFQIGCLIRPRGF